MSTRSWGWFLVLLFALLGSCASKAPEAKKPQLHDHIDERLTTKPVLAAMQLVDSVMQVPEVFRLVDAWTVNPGGDFGFKTWRPNSLAGYTEQAFRAAVLDSLESVNRQAWTIVLDRFAAAILLLYANEVQSGRNKTGEGCPITWFRYGSIDEVLYYEDSRYLTLNTTTDSILQRCPVQSLILIERAATLTLWHHNPDWHPGQK